MYLGNVISSGDAYNQDGQFVRSLDGRRIFHTTGTGLLTDTLQTAIPVLIYPPHNKEIASTFPNKNIVLPIGAQILSASLRLPSARIPGHQIQWGAQLPTGCTIIGTSTNVLKVSFGSNNTFAANATASIASANNVYALGASNRISRAAATADNANGILNTLAAVSTINLVVDNAANDAAGTGIRLSVTGQKAIIAVDVIWALPANAVQFNEIPNLSENFYIRS